jgi:hypothetical protein
MSSTIRKQQIDEIKNYNQNINRQALAKSYNQVALWELERPQLTPKGVELTTKTELSINNIQLLLQERLNVLQKLIDKKQLTVAEIRPLEKISDVVDAYNKVIEPLLNSRFDPSFRNQAKNALQKIKEPITGVIFGFDEIFGIINKNIKPGAISGLRTDITGLVEAFTLYKYINYQIDKEDYKLISVENLKSRITSTLSNLPSNIQFIYTSSKERFQPQRAAAIGRLPRKEQIGETPYQDIQAQRYKDFSGVPDFDKFIGDLRKTLGDYYVDTFVVNMTKPQLGFIKQFQSLTDKKEATRKTKEYIDNIFQDPSALPKSITKPPTPRSRFEPARPTRFDTGSFREFS